MDGLIVKNENGRSSRLLALLLGYKCEEIAGKYISILMLIGK